MKFKVNNKEVFASTGGRPFDEKKPLIVFIHGSGLSHITWVLQTRYFAFHGYSVLAIDLPGHGYSEGPALESIEEQVKERDGTIETLTRQLVQAGIKAKVLMGASEVDKKVQDTKARLEKSYLQTDSQQKVLQALEKAESEKARRDLQEQVRNLTTNNKQP